MKKKYSRRHRALRWLLGLCSASVMLQVCNVINFTSGAALRDLERELGQEKTTPLAAVDYFEVPNRFNENGMWLDRYTLATDGNTLLLSESTWEFRTAGWEANLCARYTQQDGEETGVQVLWHDSHSAPMLGIEGHFIICGRVADREVSEVTFQVAYDGWGSVQDIPDRRVQSETFTVTEFVEWNGERLFLAIFYTPEAHWISEIRMVEPENQMIFSKNG